MDYAKEKTPNVIGGPYQENRGRRGDEDWLHSREENPFENGRVRNWSKKTGWDKFYEGKRDRQGGAKTWGETHFGKGPLGYKRSDESIFDDVCESLTLSPVVDATTIEVEVQDGCVYLRGEVPSREVKRKAELEIENISGVHDVQNLLLVRRDS